MWSRKAKQEIILPSDREMTVSKTELVCPDVVYTLKPLQWFVAAFVFLMALVNGTALFLNSVERFINNHLR